MIRLWEFSQCCDAPVDWFKDTETYQVICRCTSCRLVLNVQDMSVLERIGIEAMKKFIEQELLLIEQWLLEPVDETVTADGVVTFPIRTRRSNSD